MSTLKVLVVEDDPMMSFIHKELIKKKGISSSPYCFYNGQQALEFIDRENKVDVQYLVLLDLNMPVMNGWKFLEELEKRRVSDRTSVFVVTSSTDNSDRKRAGNFEVVDGYVTKPLSDFSGIKQKINQLEVS